jgi:hypothetical protein
MLYVPLCTLITENKGSQEENYNESIGYQLRKFFTEVSGAGYAERNA